MRKEVHPYRGDKELISAVRDGDMDAFRELVEKYEQMVARIVIGMLGNKMDAEDVGQETFIRFYRSIHQYRADSSLGTYLTRIAINLSLNEIKKRKRNRWLSLEDQKLPEKTTTGEVQQKDNTEIVNLALSHLEPDFRSVVVLRILQGYSTKETAEILNIPAGTVLSRLARGQKKLKEIFINLGVKGL